MTLAAIYIRQTEKGVTPEIQRAECTLELERRGWRKAAEFVDRESLDGRPGPEWLKMLVALKSRRFTRLVAYSSERMFRDMKVMARIFENAREGGVTLHMIRDSMTTEGANGESLVRAALMVSEIEAARRSERLSSHWEMRRLRGQSVGRPPQRDPIIVNAVHSLLDDGTPVRLISRTLGIPRHMARIITKERAMAAQG